MIEVGYEQKSPKYLLDEIGYDIIAYYRAFYIFNKTLGIQKRELMLLSMFYIKKDKEGGLTEPEVSAFYGTVNRGTPSVIAKLRKTGLIEKTVRSHAKAYYITRKGSDTIKKFADTYYSEKLKLAEI